MSKKNKYYDEDDFYDYDDDDGDYDDYDTQDTYHQPSSKSSTTKKVSSEKSGSFISRKTQNIQIREKDQKFLESLIQGTSNTTTSTKKSTLSKNERDRLFTSLSKKGFKELDINSALKTCSSLNEAIEWLLINADEKDLPESYVQKKAPTIQIIAPNSNSRIIVKTQDDQSLVTKIDSKMADNIEKINHEFGFSREEIHKVLENTNNDYEKCIHTLFRSLAEKYMNNIEKPSNHNEEEDIIKQEIEVLGAIFEKDFELISDDYLRINIKFEGRDDVGESFFVVKFNDSKRKDYPLQLPTIYIENYELTGSVKHKLNKKIYEEAINHLGTQMIYPIVTWFQDNSSDLIEQFFPKPKEERKKPAVTHPKKNNNRKPVKAPVKVEQPRPCWNCGDLGHKKSECTKPKKILPSKYLPVKKDPKLDPKNPKKTVEDPKQNPKGKKQSNKDNSDKYIIFDEPDPVPKQQDKKKGYEGKSFAAKTNNKTTKEEESNTENNKDKNQDKNSNDNKDKNKNNANNNKKITVKRKETTNNSSSKSSVVVAEQLSIYQETNYTAPHLSEKQREKVASESRQLKSHLEKLRQQNNYQKLLQFRKNLPSYKMRDQILKIINENSVTIIVGDTGCGKTTQIGNFVLEDMMEKEKGSSCSIICTQPRRISAISVAERCSEEICEKIGNLVGYNIRFDTKCSDKTRLLFCTTGVLLRRLQNDPFLDKVSHIIVDEVHERSVESDFLLLILKKLVAARKDIKVILMSATFNYELFSNYFEKSPVIHIEGKTYPVKENHLEDIIEKIEYQVDPLSHYALKKTVNKVHEDIRKKVSKTTVQAIESLDLERINYDIIEKLLVYLSNKNEIDGSVMIFLPGINEINKLHDILKRSTSLKKCSSQFVFYMLHSSVSSEKQMAVFSKAPPNTFKIILTTNIAETSITIDDVTIVIDSGKHKEKRYNHSKEMESLEEVWISKANAKQRQGRAGRVKSGTCYRLYTSVYFQKFSDFQLAEILRIPLDTLCLETKSLKLGSIEKFVSDLIEPPPIGTIQNSLNLLEKIKAIKKINEEVTSLDNYELTPLGHHLSALPVAPKIGKIMIYSSIFRCVDPLLTICASMSFKSPFVHKGNQGESSSSSSSEFSEKFSDHLTLLNVFSAFESKSNKNEEYSFCQKNNLSINTMNEILKLKKQFFGLLQDINFIDKTSSYGDKQDKYNINSNNKKLIKSILCAGLYPQVAKAVAVMDQNRNSKFCLFYANDERVVVHPSSVVFRDTNELDGKYLIYLEKVKTTKLFIREISVISAIPLLLFAGDEIEIVHHKNLIILDKWIKFDSPAKIGVLIKELRAQFDQLLQKKIEKSSIDIYTSEGNQNEPNKVIKAILELINYEKI